MSDNPYRELSVQSMDSQPSLGGISMSISIYDNLDSPTALDKETRDAQLDNPIKSVSTMTVLLCLDGSAEIEVGAGNATLRRNDCLFVRSGNICVVKYVSDDAVLLSIVMGEQFFFPVMNSLSLSRLQSIWAENPVCHLTDEGAGDIVTLYRLIKREVQGHSQGPFLPEIVKGHVQSIVFIIYSHFLSRENPVVKEKFTHRREIFNRFLELVERDYAKERSIKYYASKLCITSRYLSQLVYQESGIYAGDHIDNFVISEAKHLLKSRKYTVLQVSEMLSFSSQSQFGRYFKTFTGMTPGEFLSQS